MFTHSYTFLLLLGNHVADCIQLDGTIEEKIKHLKADFAAIVIETRGHLEELYSNVENAATWLNEILRGNEDEPLVVEESAPDYSKLFRQLQKKWSFTRPDLLQQLVDELTIVSLKKRMQAYTERYDAFCHSFPINKETKAKSVQFEPRDPRQPCLVIIFESISKYFNIEVFLTDVFKIYKRYLRVHKIDLDSVQRVTVQFAASMEPHLQACIDQGKETARRHRVTDIHIEPQTETQQLTATQDNTTHTEEKTQKEVETLAIDCETIENKSKMTETRILRKRVNSKPNGVIKNKKSKTKKITNGEMIPCYD